MKTRHAFCPFLGCILHTRTLDALAQAQSDHTFPFPTASPTLATFLCFLGMSLEPFGNNFLDNVLSEVGFLCVQFKGCRKRDECDEWRGGG